MRRKKEEERKKSKNKEMDKGGRKDEMLEKHEEMQGEHKRG